MRRKPTFGKNATIFLQNPRRPTAPIVYQPKAGFSLGAYFLGQRAGFDSKVKYSYSYLGEDTATMILKGKIVEIFRNRVGGEIGYGCLNFGYAFEVGSKSAVEKKLFSFKFMNPVFGVSFEYYKICNPFYSSLEMGEADDEDYYYSENVISDVAVMRCFSIDGYYAFNHERFAYTATYKPGKIQRRTAGSWMVAARYVQGSLFNTPENAFDALSIVDCYSTLQFSLGGGYSINIVPWHRDPVDERDKGLRNLTFNITAMPMITPVNYIRATMYEYVDNGDDVIEHRSKWWCHPMLSYLGSASASFSIWRFYLSVQFNYNYYYFINSSKRLGTDLDLSQSEDLSFRAPSMTGR